MADNQLILVVEGTAAMGPFWNTILTDYLDKIIRSFCGSELNAQKPSASNGSGSVFELALVVFNTHGPYSASLVQRSAWTKDVDNFMLWLTSLTFSGGGLNDVATAEGLAEALMMFAIPQNGYQTQQNLEGKRHCILVSASNPYPLPTPVYRPAIENLDHSENGDAQTGNLLFDTETVAKWFGQCSVSLSVICPKQLPKLKTLYNVGKRILRATDPPVDVKQPHFLVLISDSFMEARAALSRTGLAPIQNSVSTLPPGSGPPPPLSAVNGPVINRPTISNGIVPQATVKVEPSTVTSMTTGPGPTLPHMPSIPRATAQSVPTLQASSPPSVSQEPTTNNENIPELKPMVSMSQSLRPVGAILNNLSQARVMSSAALTAGTSLGLPSIGGNPISMHMSNMISSGMSSTVPPSQAVLSSGQPGITTASGSGTIPGTSQAVQNSTLSSFSSATSGVTGNSTLSISQPLNNLQGSINNTLGQPVLGIGQGNVQAVTQNGSNMNPNMISNLGSNVVASGTGSMIPTPGMPQQVQPGMQTNPSANMSLSQSSAILPSSQSKYVNVWEGNLSGQRQGQPVFITRLEGYRNATASETLAANWPSTMQIVRLISQDHMNNKQYVGKADFLVFRAKNQHGFLAQLQEKKLCAVIQLPSQTLLLSVSDKACRLIGMLFPGDMVVFKPQIPSQQQHLQHQQQQNQQQQQQPHPQLQQQQLQHLQQQTMQPLQQQPQMQQPKLQQQPQMQPPQMQQQLQHLPQQPQNMQPQMQQQLQHLPQQQQVMQQLQHQQHQQQQMSQLQQHQTPQLQQQQQQLPQLQQQQPQFPQLQTQPQPQPQPQQQQFPQLQHQSQIPQLQQQQQLQQLQQLSQPQQMVGVGMGQGYMQGPGRPQLVPQGQVPSQGTPTNMPGGGFMG